MRWLAACALGAGLCALPARARATETESPDAQTLVFYNARLALRDGRPKDVLKLWFVRNALSLGQPPATTDGDFLSLVWTALGDLALCQQNLERDGEGAGLWPLALHNFVARVASAPEAPSRPSPFESFEVGRQERFISIHDVLAHDEIRSVAFFRSSCSVPGTNIAVNGRGRQPLADRIATGQALQRLLWTALSTLNRTHVESVAPVQARLFDLDLALLDAQSRNARLAGVAARQKARALGLSDVAAQEVAEAAAAWPLSAPQATFLRQTLTWRAQDWLTLSRDRRLFLYVQARAYADDSVDAQKPALEMVDALVERQLGEEAELWIALLPARASLTLRRQLTSGDRGLRLLSLDAASGFRERSVVALHRGVAFVEGGQLRDALQSFAFGLAHADTSREPAAVAGLSRRWLAYVLGRFTVDDDVIAILKALLPVQDYRFVAADLVWRAALRGDGASFDALVATIPRGSAFDAQAADLKKLAHGKPGDFLAAIERGAAEAPSQTLRFCERLLENVEAEDADVRLTHVSTMRGLARMLEGLAAQAGASGAQHRVAEALAGRTQALLEGLKAGETPPPRQARARALSAEHATFAGNVHVAPTDELPWPFKEPEPQAPSAFTPLRLLPIEWQDHKGTRVFGWRISD